MFLKIVEEVVRCGREGEAWKYKID